MARESSPITLALQRMRDGDPDAEAQLLPLVYAELKALARARMAREPRGQTLQPTALVHEAFMRLTGGSGFDGSSHFFASAGRAMRRILVEQARRRARRGPDESASPEPSLEPPDDRVLDVDAALHRLEARDPRKAEIVNLRYFAGLTVPEIAAALGTSVGTIEREWRLTRAMLQRELDSLRP